MGDDRSSMRRSVAGLLTAQFTSQTAMMAQTVVLGKIVYDLSASKLDLGLLGLAEFAPAALLVLVTGSVADRLERTRVVAASVLAEAVTAGAIGWYVGTKPASVVPIFGLVVLFGTAQAFRGPAMRSLPADLAIREELPRLVARNSAAWQAALIAGPILGGVLLTIDVHVTFAVIAALLVCSSIAINLVRIDPRERSRASSDARPRAGLREALEGLRFVRRQPLLLGAISLDLFAVLFGGAVALLPAIAKDRLGVGAVGLGGLRAAGGIGAGMTTLILAVRPVTRQVGRTLLVVVALFGCWTVLLGVTRQYAVAFVAMVALSGADAVSVFIRATLVPLVTPHDKRGRVLAVENVFIGASNELGAFESGVTGQLIGTSGSVVLGGVATLAVAAAWWALFPSLREVDRFPQYQANAAPQDDGSV